MSDDNLYMNGHGVSEKTDELIDALWAEVPIAIVSTSLIFIGPLLSWAFFIHRFPWEPPITGWHWVAAGGVSILSVALGVLGSLRYWRAERVLRKHTSAMRRETERRGEGWASS